jgi:hypothetical protein
MNYQRFDLGMVNAGRIVEVVLTGSATNVRLLDDKNLLNYTRGKDYKFEGGLTTKSPVRLQVPSRGHWYVVLDWEGQEGTAQATVTLLKE